MNSERRFKHINSSTFLITVPLPPIFCKFGLSTRNFSFFVIVWAELPLLGGGTSPRISKYWGGGQNRKKSPKYLVLNGRKQPKCLVLKKPKTFMAHLGLKQHYIALYFRFYCIFMLKLAQELIFLAKNVKFF